MGSIVFLPGILGSELRLDDELVWPPTPWEVTTNYGRTGKLLDEKIKAGPPIASVACFGVYRSLLADLADIASGAAGAPKRTLQSFGYDWRRDLRDIAADIVRRIDALPEEDKDEIRFVGHSMGCLVVRLILESGLYDGRPWFGAVRSFTALAGPHKGAPTALVRVLGLEGTLGLSPADVKRIAADPRYPALYQLLPAPDVTALVDARGDRMTRLDIYDAVIATRAGLAAANLAKAQEVHAILAADRRPDHVDYRYLGGSGNDTWLRVDLFGDQMTPRKGPETGDGTVPLWSAIDPRSSHHAAPGTHEKVFQNEQLRTLMYFSLGARPAARAFANVDSVPLLSLFVTHPVVGIGVPVELTLVPARPTGKIVGELLIEYTRSADAVFRPFDKRTLSYDGEPLELQRLLLTGLNEAGIYRVTFSGSHAMAEGGEAVCAVSESGGVRRG